MSVRFGGLFLLGLRGDVRALKKLDVRDLTPESARVEQEIKCIWGWRSSISLITTYLHDPPSDKQYAYNYTQSSNILLWLVCMVFYLLGHN